jgi:hypothetical protein
MDQKLIKLSIFDHVHCSICGTKHDESPNGMYLHEKYDANGAVISFAIVCAICILYTHKDVYAKIPKE